MPGVNAGGRGRMEVSLRCHNSPRRNWVTGCGWRHAPQARGGLCENLKKESELETRHQTRKIDFWSSQTRGELAPYGGRSRWGPKDSIEDCVSPSYVETFNSKLIRRFRTWTRSRYVFSNSEIPMFYRNEYYMSVSHMAIFVYLTTQQFPLLHLQHVGNRF